MTPRRASPLLLVLLASPLGCGTDVDLGGAPGGQDAHHDVGSGTCPSFAPPDAKATCTACGADGQGCTPHTPQPNGCYGGYFCDTSGKSDCKAPGTPCSGTVKFDAH